MKQLELTVKIEQVDDSDCPYEITVYAEDLPKNPAWFKGKTLKEAMERFINSFPDNNLRYWFKLKDK